MTIIEQIISVYHYITYVYEFETNEIQMIDDILH